MGSIIVGTWQKTDKSWTGNWTGGATTPRSESFDRKENVFSNPNHRNASRLSGKDNARCFNFKHKKYGDDSLPNHSTPPLPFRKMFLKLSCVKSLKTGIITDCLLDCDFLNKSRHRY